MGLAKKRILCETKKEGQEKAFTEKAAGQPNPQSRGAGWKAEWPENRVTRLRAKVQNHPVTALRVCGCR